MCPNGLKPGYEFVYTVTDYHDGRRPLRGIANYQGQPHLYERIFDESMDDYTECFKLVPLDPETFQLAMEAWEIWLRWESAFHSDEAGVSTHPALPGRAKRYAELMQALDKVLVTGSQAAVTRIGQFEVVEETSLARSMLRHLQVKWTES
jgi:hypothetical protein